jgi:hypothetical protein
MIDSRIDSSCGLMVVRVLTTDRIFRIYISTDKMDGIHGRRHKKLNINRINFTNLNGEESAGPTESRSFKAIESSCFNYKGEIGSDSGPYEALMCGVESDSRADSQLHFFPEI